MPNDTSQPLPKDPETLMRELAATVHQHAGPASSGKLASIGIPALGIDDIHFSLSSGEAMVNFRTGGGDMEARTLDAEECQAISGFFAGLATLLGFKP